MSVIMEKEGVSKTLGHSFCDVRGALLYNREVEIHTGDPWYRYVCVCTHMFLCMYFYFLLTFNYWLQLRTRIALSQIKSNLSTSAEWAVLECGMCSSFTTRGSHLTRKDRTLSVGCGEDGWVRGQWVAACTLAWFHSFSLPTPRDPLRHSISPVPNTWLQFRYQIPPLQWVPDRSSKMSITTRPGPAHWHLSNCCFYI